MAKTGINMIRASIYDFISEMESFLRSYIASSMFNIYVFCIIPLAIMNSCLEEKTSREMMDYIHSVSCQIV